MAELELSSVCAAFSLFGASVFFHGLLVAAAANN
jgi:hypothetical protein